jgi:hypothetical protein
VLKNALLLGAADGRADEEAAADVDATGSALCFAGALGGGAVAAAPALK